MKKYNFDQTIDRTGTSCVKYDLRKQVFGNEDVIPMWVADMDFPTADFIREAVAERASQGVFGYTFRDEAYYGAIAQWLWQRHGWEVEKEWISFTPGVTVAINMAVMAFTAENDKIIIQQPVYPPFINIVRNRGRQLVNNGLIDTEDGFRMDFDLLEEQAKDAKMLILCNPHNPVGRCWTKEELLRLGDICIRNDVLVLSDEVHCDLVMPAHKHMPFASLSEEIAQNTITCFAASKTFNLAGLATSSVIIGNKEIRDRFTGFVHSLDIDLGNVFGKISTKAAFEQGGGWLSQLVDYLNGNIDYAYDFIKKEMPRIRVHKPEATYLMWLDFTDFGLDNETLKKKMIFEAGLGLNNGLDFGEEGRMCMRINLACPRSVVETALERMKKVFG